MKNISNEVFEYHKEQSPPYVFQDLNHSEIFPYLIVNIGSGVSMIKVILTWRQTVEHLILGDSEDASRHNVIFSGENF